MAENDDNKPRGRGWFGNSAGHAAAGRLGGRKSRGNFKYDRKRASIAGKRGGSK